MSLFSSTTEQIEPSAPSGDMQIILYAALRSSLLTLEFSMLSSTTLSLFSVPSMLAYLTSR